jgi:AcrR family transcriptional regulator
MVSRQEQYDRRKQEILLAALDLFISKGYSDTRISDIAEKVGMSVGLLFHYFESKAKLYEELILIGASGPTSMMQLDAGDPLRFFEMVANTVITALREQPFFAKMFVLMEQFQYNTSPPESLKDLAQTMGIIEETAAIVKRGQALGQIRAGDPQALAILFWQALSGVALYAAYDPTAPIPKAEWIVDCLRDRPSTTSAFGEQGTSDDANAPTPVDLSTKKKRRKV